MLISEPLRRVAICTIAALSCTVPAAAAAPDLGSHMLLTNAPRFASLPARSSVVNFGVHLPLRDRAQLEAMVEVQSDPKSPMYRHWLKPAQFRANFGPSAATINDTVAYLHSLGFSITKVDSQLIHVAGAVSTVERAFHVHLGNVRQGKRFILATREQLAIPKELNANGATVVGLGYRVLPQPQSHLVPQNRYSTTGGYFFDDLKQAYKYPAYQALTGKGVTIATVGYSDFSSKDQDRYTGHELLGQSVLSIAPAPHALHLAFSDSLPFDPSEGTSDEANLDVQQASGSALGATVVGIAAPATNAEGFLYAYSYIVDNDSADIVSTSYGECELFYTAAYNGGTSYVDVLKAYHDFFLQGNAQGITFIFSSGDDSARACPQLGYLANPGAGALYKDVPGTSIWSDDPNVTSVGGTNLVTSKASTSKASKYVAEDATADTILSPIDPYGVGNAITNALWGSGGGPSVIFKAPPYQTYTMTKSTMRVSPDVSMHMGGCPGYADFFTGKQAQEICGPDDSFDYAVIAGNFYGFIGTSASAPEFAGLLALKEQQLGGRLGNANVLLYEAGLNQSKYAFFHQGIPGYNGVVTVAAGAPGYNPIVGLGTPDTIELIGGGLQAVAGKPQTSTNP